MLVATPGMIAPAATATKPAIKAYSMRSWPRVSFQILSFQTRLVIRVIYCSPWRRISSTAMSKLSPEDAMLHRSKHLEIIRNSHRADTSGGLASVVLWLQKHTPQSGAENIAAAPNFRPGESQGRGIQLRRADRREWGFRRGPPRENSRGRPCSHLPPSPTSRLAPSTGAVARGRP